MTLPAVAARRALRAVRLPPGERIAATGAALRHVRERASVLGLDGLTAVRGRISFRYVAGGAGALIAGLLRVAASEGDRLERGAVELRLGADRSPVAVVGGRERRVDRVVVTAGFSGDVSIARGSAALVGEPVTIAGTAWDAFAALSEVARAVRGLVVLDSHGDLSNKLAPRARRDGRRQAPRG